MTDDAAEAAAPQPCVADDAERCAAARAIKDRADAWAAGEGADELLDWTEDYCLALADAALDARDAALREAREQIENLRADAANDAGLIRGMKEEVEQLRRERESAVKIIAAEIGARPQPATPSPVPTQYMSESKVRESEVRIMKELRRSTKLVHDGGAKASTEDVARARALLPSSWSAVWCEYEYEAQVKKIAAALSARGAEGERAGIERCVDACDPVAWPGQIYREVAEEIQETLRALLPPAAPETK